MRHFGIIGNPLSHSFSPAYFSQKFASESIDARYDAFPLASITDLPDLLREHQLEGLNVTIPYKTSILPYLNELSSAAMAIGAVNCLKIEGNRLLGYNTDYYGFATSLKPLLQAGHKRALILGTGGAAQAVQYALRQMDMPFLSVSRTGDDLENTIRYSALSKDILQQHQVIINTSPLGMFPLVDDCPPIPYEFVDERHLLYDLIYNPAITRFLRKGKQRNATIKNGLEMLHLQAERSWDIWNGIFTK
jgi:shikimate dehydrogenase